MRQMAVNSRRTELVPLTPQTEAQRSALQAADAASEHVQAPAEPMHSLGADCTCN